MNLPACPKCHNTEEVFYSRTTSAERFFSIVRIFPLRCTACSHRFYRFTKAPSQDGAFQQALPHLPEHSRYVQHPPATGNPEESAEPTVPPESSSWSEADSVLNLPSVADAEVESVGVEEYAFTAQELEPEIAEESVTVGEHAFAAQPAIVEAVAEELTLQEEPGSSWRTPVAVEGTALDLQIAAAPLETMSFEGNGVAEADPPALEAGVDQEERAEAEEKPRRGFWTGDQGRWTLRGCAVLIAFRLIIGFCESSLVGMRAMWVNLLTVEALLGTVIVYLYLRHASPDNAVALRSVIQMTASWLALYLVVDAGILMVFLPLKNGTPISLSAFNVPWLWISYAMLPLAGLLGYSGYTWSSEQVLE